MHTDNKNFKTEYNDNDFNVDSNVDVDENFYGYEDNDSNNDNNNNKDEKSDKSKKIIIIVIVAILLLACIGGLIFFLVRNNNSGNGGNGGEQPVLTPSITLSETTFELKVGASKKITYNVENYNGDISVIWSTSNTSIATVDKNGTVKAVKEGIATITATYTIDGQEYKKTCSVTVSKSGGTTTPTVTLSKTKLELKVGTSEKITYTVSTGNVTVTWSSSNTSIATVDKNGTVKGVKAGTATITASYTVNGTKQQKTCSVTVKKADGGGTTTPIVDTTKPTLSHTITSGKENTWVNTDVSIKVTATDNVGIDTVKFTTNCNSNCKYTTVSDGIIKVSTAGSSVITIVATDKAGNSIEKKVTVMIDKTKPTCSLAVSETGTLSAKYNDATGGSGMAYYGFASSYSGTPGNTQTLSSAGTYTYYVKDKAGNTNTCSLPVKTKTQYKYQDCTSCKRCYDAGCEEWYWKASGITSYTGSCNTAFPKIVGDIRYTNCYNSTVTSNGNCAFTCSYDKVDCRRRNQSCEKCGGCDSWGNESGWEDNIVASASRRITNTRTIYYSE